MGVLFLTKLLLMFESDLFHCQFGNEIELNNIQHIILKRIGFIKKL